MAEVEAEAMGSGEVGFSDAGFGFWAEVCGC